jgi:hypothetical protein
MHAQAWLNPESKPGPPRCNALAGLAAAAAAIGSDDEVMFQWAVTKPWGVFTSQLRSDGYLPQVRPGLLSPLPPPRTPPTHTPPPTSLLPPHPVSWL